MGDVALDHDVSNLAANLVSLGVFEAMQNVCRLGRNQMRQGWTKRFFCVKRDARGARSLYWYQFQGDNVSQGVIPLVNLNSVASEQDEVVPTLPAVLVLHVSDGRSQSEQTLELRSRYVHERDRWARRL